jgi:hypothetical protein
MESYKGEAQEFVSCTKRDVDGLIRKSNESIEEYNNAVESFNRRPVTLPRETFRTVRSSGSEN